MKASKEWGPCNCDCGTRIKAGDEMIVIDGDFFLAGHENARRTRFIETIKKGEKPKKLKKK